MTPLLVVILTGAVLGFATRRLAVVPAVVGAVVVYYAGLANGWWGYGTGDLWQFAMALVIFVACAVVTTAVMAGKASRR